MTRKFEIADVLSMLGIWGLLGFLAWYLGGIPVLARELPLFFSGHLSAIRNGNESFPLMMGVLAGVAFINIPVAFVAAWIVEKALGEARNEEEGGEIPWSPFTSLFVINFLEEVFARWLPLGLLGMLPLLGSTGGFYTLALVFNVAWAYVHVYNYQRKRDRHWLRVLPQFLGGLTLIFAFAKFGFFPTLLCHVTYNAVVFSQEREQELNWVDAAIVVVNLVFALVAYSLMQHPLADIGQWFQTRPVFELDGWGFWDYLKVVVFVTAGLEVVFSILLFDRPAVHNEDGSHVNEDIGAIDTMVGLSIAWLLNLVMSSYLYCVVLVAVGFCFRQKQSTGNALSRTFLAGVPAMYVTLCAMAAVGFWHGVVLAVVMGLVRQPHKWLREIDT